MTTVSGKDGYVEWEPGRDAAEEFIYSTDQALTTEDVKRGREIAAALAEDGVKTRFYFDPGPATHWVDGRRHNTPLEKCPTCIPVPMADPTKGETR